MQRSLVYGDQVCFKQILTTYVHVPDPSETRWPNCWTAARYGKTMNSRSTTYSLTMRNLLHLHRWAFIIRNFLILFSSPFRAPRLDILRWANQHFQAYPRQLKTTRTTVKASWAETQNLDWSVNFLRALFGLRLDCLWRLVSLKRCPSHDIIAVIRPVANWYVQHLLLSIAAI